MGATVLALCAAFAALIVGLYPLYIGPTLTLIGVYRSVNNLGTRNCRVIPELQACEKMILHQPSGLLYLGCSTPAARQRWFKYSLPREPPAPSEYLAIYDPSTHQTTRLDLGTFDPSTSAGFHGIDVVPSLVNPDELYVYLIHHRRPALDQNIDVVGWDSVVEVFQTHIGSRTLSHLKTVSHPLILKPNDIIGSPDGKSFYFTNDSPVKTGGSLQAWKALVLHPETSVVHCHTDTGCHVAIANLPTNNGITRAKNGTIYVASTFGQTLHVLEEEPEARTLSIDDVIAIDYPMENVSIDEDGLLWVAGIPKIIKFASSLDDTTRRAPSTVLRLSSDLDRRALSGRKYHVEKAWEDDGGLATGATTVIRDSRRGRLFITGLLSPHLVDCVL